MRSRSCRWLAIASTITLIAVAGQPPIESKSRYRAPGVKTEADRKSAWAGPANEATLHVLDVDSPSSALHVLPPLGSDRSDAAVLDGSLLGFVVVSIRQVGGEASAPLAEYTARSGQRLDRVLLQHNTYHVNFKVPKAQAGTELGILFSVAGLDLKSIRCTPATNRSIPIRFQIDNHPRIRARVLHDTSHDAHDVAVVLRDEFGLSALETARILSDERYDVLLIVPALCDAFSASVGDIARILQVLGYGAFDVARILRDVGHSSVDVGRALMEVFDLAEHGVAQVLKDVGFSAVEVGRTLADVFALDAGVAAQVLKDVSFGAVETGRTLKQVFGLDVQAAADIFEDVGFDALAAYEMITLVYGVVDNCTAEQTLDAATYGAGEYLGVIEFQTVMKFAPVVMFDRAYKGLPMSAQDWYVGVLCGGYKNCPGPNCNPFSCLTEGEQLCQRLGLQFPCLPQNNAMWRLTEGHVPTYYKVTRCGTCQLRINYWWYYGMQPNCVDCVFAHKGFHVADWENMMVITDEARSSARAVTYFQHNGWYTRLNGAVPGFDLATGGIRPVVYVGKKHHGSYVDDCCASGCDSNCISNWCDIPYECDYFGDFRNPVPATVWDTGVHSHAMVNLDGGAESWIPANREKGWAWGGDGIYTRPPDPTRNEYQCAILQGCFGTGDFWSTDGRGCHATHLVGLIPSLDSGFPGVLPPASTGSPPAVAEELIAATLGITVDEYRAAMATGQTLCELATSRGLNLVTVWIDTESARQTVVQQAVDDASITEAEGVALLQAMADPPEWCPNVAEVRDEVISMTLGIPLGDYLNAVANGETLCELVDVLGLDLEQAWVDSESARRAIIQQALSDGLINQIEADWVDVVLSDPPERCWPDVAGMGEAVGSCRTTRKSSR